MFALQFAISAEAQMSWNVREGRVISAPSCLTVNRRPASCTQQDWRAWLDDIKAWRAQRRLYIGYSDERYKNPKTLWASHSFIQTQVGVEDRYLYDVNTGKYTVDRYLDDLVARYGGIDSVLVWPFYPNSGIDARNQMDMIRSMPGGVTGVRDMVSQFHRRGVKVLFPMMMWDQGTRDPGRPWPEEIAAVMKEIGADGVNGDTFDGVPLAFNLASDKSNVDLVFEPELPFDDRGVANNLMGWGYYQMFDMHYGLIPMLDRAKWLEPRHMIHVNQRFARDRTDDIHTAFFMGAGYESWENVWGIWNGMTPRNAALLRRYSAIARFAAEYLTSEGWEPYYPTQRVGTFASRWPVGDESVWTLVNRNDFTVDGVQLAVESAPGLRYFDLYHGVELTPGYEDGKAILSFELEARGIGAIIATSHPDMSRLQPFLNAMRDGSAVRLEALSNEWRPLSQKLVEAAKTRAYEATPDGMIDIPAANFQFNVSGVEIEEDNGYVDVQYPWESSPRRDHVHPMRIDRFFIDRFPVTNRHFSSFLEGARYSPKDSQNFLPGWTGRTPPAGSENKPVTGVSIEDAQAYCAWSGKRLPREWEWQYAASGKERLVYPWGNAWRVDAVPQPDQSRNPRMPDDVGQHRAGASPFGVEDMVGLVWQWTDEFTDEHTRSAVLRGGSYYQPAGSMWYFPQAYSNEQHDKLILMAPGKDRSPMIGFRCAADAQQ